MLIVLEGIDGTGKGTQSKILVERLQAGWTGRGFIPRFLDTRSHSSERWSVEYLNGDFGTDVHPKLASLAYMMDRRESRGDLEAQLAVRDVVVCDRYTQSNMHQVAKLRDNSEALALAKWLYETEYGLFELPLPDLVVQLDLSVKFAVKLIEKKSPRVYTDKVKDLHEADEEYLGRVRSWYSKVATLTEVRGAKDWREVSVERKRSHTLDRACGSGCVGKSSVKRAVFCCTQKVEGEKNGNTETFDEQDQEDYPAWHGQACGIKKRKEDDYSNEQYGKDDSLIPRDDRCVNDKLCRVNVVRPRFKEGPLVFRPWPALDANDPEHKLKPGRISANERGQSRWLVRVPIANYVGLDEEGCEQSTFVLYRPGDKKAKAKELYQEFFRACYNAHDAGNFGEGRDWLGSWNRYMKGAKNKGAAITTAQGQILHPGRGLPERRQGLHGGSQRRAAGCWSRR